jgi:energy-coupling factor transporter ATP-binding protein EcfA2
MPTGPQRLILIRSGRYEYAEVDLAGALQIVGPNNTGKTTLINTLQFLYLDDRRHMDFGSYTAEQTRDFYFPNQYSYILFECLGATGQCVVGWRGQSKTSGGDPERFFYSGPFAAADFLDQKNQVREPREVNARLALKQFRVIKSAQEQKELLLPALNGDARGLGIVALRDSDKYHHFRETLKNLLTLSAITQEQMRDRLLMLADIPLARPAFDARELFGDDYDRIRSRREKLLKFKKHQALVEQLVNKFAERETVRGELIWRWTDLRGKRQKYENDQEKDLTKLRAEKATAERKVSELGAQLTDRRNDVTTFSVEKGKRDKPLEDLKALDKEFGSFAEELERAALANLKKEIQSLEMQLASAEGESRDKANQKVAFFTEQVKTKEQTIEHFDRLVVTGLRKNFSDEELSTVFRLLNRDLLELPVGKNGVVVSRRDEVIATLRGLLEKIREGMYTDAALSFPLPKTGEPLAGLENPDTAREQLKEYQATLERWKKILSAIEQREKIEGLLKSKREEAYGRTGKEGEILIEGKELRLFRCEEYKKAKANEPRLRAELKKVEASIEAANARIAKLTGELKGAEKAQSDAEGSIRKQEDDFNKVMGNFGQCIFPEFKTKARVAEGIPDDFDAAIALFVKQQDAQEDLCNGISNLILQSEQWFGDEFRGADEYETIGTLQEELEALAEKEEALSRDWNAHIHGLKATFDLVLKNLDHVRSAATNLNRAFARVQVSNLKAVKLEVVEQSDLVSWIKRLPARRARCAQA